jgi:sialate O-acetylesterase
LIPEHYWVRCSPDTVGDFSAAGFFFGRMLNQELDIPIGLIDAAWGGAAAEAFMSRGALNAFPEFESTIKEIQDNQYTNENLERMRNEAIAKWGTEVDKLDAGTKDEEKWYMPQYDDSAWENIKLPSSHDGKFVDFDGVAWYRRTIDMPQELAGKELTLDLGVINYEDDTYFNGQLVGNTAGTSYERNYRIPAELVKEGENLICVRLLEKGQHGGFYNQEDRMNIGTADKKIDLRGTWKVAKGIQFNLLPEYPQYAIKVRHAPNMIYNAMIQPLTNLSVKGVIWYQGESNSERAWQYRKLFPAMIEDWRETFKCEDLPFYFVQLANYMPRKDKPVDDDWAELRWAQRYALKLENTGMAVAIDIGEANNIHPKNKQDVGKRLALIALNQTYGKDVAYLGPELANMSIEGSQVTLEFDNTEGGLVVPEGKELKEFALAGEDKTFYWATAKIEGNKVILSSPRVPNPVAVRYGWQQNPECNLYNQAGLPASPFKTDDWEWITKGNELN